MKNPSSGSGAVPWGGRDSQTLRSWWSLVANFAKGARNRHYEHLINEPESEPTKQLKYILYRLVTLRLAVHPTVASLRIGYWRVAVLWSRLDTTGWVCILSSASPCLEYIECLRILSVIIRTVKSPRAPTALWRKVKWRRYQSINQ
jgi:hypothetical protein